VQEHLNRLGANETKNTMNTVERVGATGVDQFSRAHKSHMDKVNQEKPKSEKPQTDENKRRVVETGASNNY
jgi:hypothetical protein